MSREGPRSVMFELSDPNARVKTAKEVEEQLENTCRRLNETEINIKLLGKMAHNGVATNDVRSFVTRQAELKSEDHVINSSLTKCRDSSDTKKGPLT